MGETVEVDEVSVQERSAVVVLPARLRAAAVRVVHEKIGIDGERVGIASEGRRHVGEILGSPSVVAIQIGDDVTGRDVKARIAGGADPFVPGCDQSQLPACDLFGERPFHEVQRCHRCCRRR